MDGRRGRPAGRLAALLRSHRAVAGLTQRELADRAGISIGALEDLEQGRTAHPRRESLARLATVLGLTGHQLAELTAAPDWAAAPDRAAAPRGPAAAGLRVAVLGPLAAWRDGQQLDLGPVRQRAVLGLLALHVDAGLPRMALVEALWREAPPSTAVTMIQAHVGRVRRVLGPEPASDGPRLTWDGSCYRLSQEGMALDLAEFADITGQARRVAAAGDGAGACGLYRRALDLWRGEVLADVDLLYGHPAVTELARRRAEVVIEYASAAVGAGLPDQVIVHLEALAAREPLDERAHAQLMLALAATGRQGAALGVYDGLVRRLDAELGVRPGPQVAAAHMQILRQQVPPASAGPAPSPLVPRQLPPAVPRFAGRAAEIAVLTGLLEQAGEAAGTVVISAIGGTAGIGKTALALHWAHRVADRFPDGQFFVNLRGFGPADPVTPTEALCGFLDALQVPAGQVPVTLAGQQGLYRSLLAGKRTLIVLDNARDAEQVRPLLPGVPGCMVLVTSRNQLSGLVAAEGAHLLTLDVLSAAEAQELLAQRIGPARLIAEAGPAGELVQLCARLPLALAITAARAGTHAGFPLAALAAELRDARSRLDTLATGEHATDVRAVFSWSYARLPAASARLFRLLGLHPGPDIAVPAVASLAGLPDGHARAALAELARASLVAEHVSGRYTLHDLLHVYAAERAYAEDGEPGCRAAIHRLLDHYLHTCHSAAQLMQAQRGALALAPPQPGVMAEQLAGHEQALAWFKAEHHVLVAVAGLAAGSGFDTCAWQLPWSMATFLDWQGHWHDWVATQRSAVAAVTRQGDEGAQAMVRRAFAAACIRLGDYAEAHIHLAECLRIYVRLGDLAGESRIQRDLGNLFEYQGRYTEALDHAERALGLSQAVADRAGQATALSNAGWYQIMLGHHHQALSYCRRALKLHRELGARYGEAHTWSSLGAIHHQLGTLARAVACHRQALRLFRELGDRVYEATALTHLGDAHRAAGRDTAARRAWQQALAILDELRHPDAGEVRARLGQGPGGAAAPSPSATAGGPPS